MYVYIHICIYSYIYIAWPERARPEAGDVVVYYSSFYSSRYYHISNLEPRMFYYRCYITRGRLRHYQYYSHRLLIHVYIISIIVCIISVISIIRIAY